MKANFDYTFRAKDKEGNPILKNGKPMYKAYYTLSGDQAEVQAFIDWRTSKGWQVRYNENGRVQIAGRPPLDSSKSRLYNVKSADLGSGLTYWIDFSEITEGLASISAADHYQDDAFTAEVRKQTVSDLRGSSISQSALAAVQAVVQAAPANLVDPIEE